MMTHRLLALLLTGVSAAEALTLPAHFADHMVLPRDVPVPLQGGSDPGAQITVEFAGRTNAVRADAEGRWSLVIPPLPASAQPGALRVVEACPNCPPVEQTLSNVVVGEVWLCSGQSNMRWMHRQVGGTAEAAPDLRMLNLVPFDFRGGKRTRAEVLAIQATNYFAVGGWKPSAPGAEDFSAVAYYFGRKLQADLGVPVGLILNAVGGAPIEAFLPRATLAADPILSPLLDDWLNNSAYPRWCRERARSDLGAWFREPQGAPPHHAFELGFLFESGVQPLAGFPVRGAIWYQGESNATDGSPGAPAENPAVNEHKLRTMIAAWRASFAQPDMAFLMVQLPGLNRDWEVFREVQARVARGVPGCGMAVTIDVGHPTNVHPPDKRPVGERLALQALARVYGRKVVADGPTFRGLSIAGDALTVQFDHAEGLATRDSRPPVGFEIAGRDLLFQPALAAIDGTSVRLRADGVISPVAVRYLWADDPTNNLVNAAGLPAAPFSTRR